MPKSTILLAVLFSLLHPKSSLGQSAANPGPRESAQVILPSSANWAACAGWKSGCESAVLRGDPEQGPSQIIVRLAPAAVIPRMFHTSTEEFVMVSGTFQVKGEDGKEFTLVPGSYSHVPAGVIHGNMRCVGPEPCVFYESHDRPNATTIVQTGG